MRARPAHLAAAGAGLGVAAATVPGAATGLLGLVPALALFALLLLGRTPGAERLERWRLAAGARRRAPRRPQGRGWVVRRRPRSQRGGGGAVLARRLAGRAPPAPAGPSLA